MKKTPIRPKKALSPRPSKKRRKVIELDAEWSKAVRERDENRCRICNRTDNLQAHHIFTKGRHASVRHDIKNGVCLCWACHLYKVHTDPEFWRDTILSHLTEEEYENLKTQANKIKKGPS